MIEQNMLRYKDNVITVVFDTNNDPWWKAKDVAEAIGYANTDEAVRRHIDDEDRCYYHSLNNPRETRGLHPNTVFINESGLYTLIIGSELPAAKLFKRWVTSEVLPSIRKYGEYKLKLEHQKDRALAEKQITDLNRQLESLKLTRTDPPKDQRKHPQFILIRKNTPNSHSYYVLRIQKGNREYKIRKVLRFCPDAEVLLTLDVSNSVSLYIRLKHTGLITHDGNHFSTHLEEVDLIQAIIDARRDED